MKKQPHILLISCDEMRLDTLSCYGGTAVDTPNIDRLAKTGTQYENCYSVSPWCLPARCAMLTGLYPHRSGAYSNFRRCSLDGDLPNLFKELKGAGYTTSLFGKCHFAPVPYSETRPDRTLPYDGFKEYYLSLGLDRLELQDDKQVSIWYYDDYSKELDAAGYLQPYRDLLWNNKHGKVFPFPGPAEWHPDAWVGGRAVRFLQEQPQGEQPNFTWVSFSGPHYPFDAPKEYYGRVRRMNLPKRRLREGELAPKTRIQHKSFYGEGNIDGCHPAPGTACKNYSEEYWKQLQICYYANVALIDDEVGRILGAVEARWKDNVLVIFTADHGEMLGNHGVWGKHNCGYDDVWRIPMLVRFPGQATPQKEMEKISLLDVFPTCLTAAGVVPATCDGMALQGRTEFMPYVFAEGEGYCAVTDGHYKYIHVQKPGERYTEFLDLSDDPDEFKNQMDNPTLADEQSHLLQKLLEHFMPAVLP